MIVDQLLLFWRNCLQPIVSKGNETDLMCMYASVSVHICIYEECGIYGVIHTRYPQNGKISLLLQLQQTVTQLPVALSYS